MEAEIPEEKTSEEETPEEEEEKETPEAKIDMESLAIHDLKFKVAPIIHQFDYPLWLPQIISMYASRVCVAYIKNPDSFNESVMEFEKKMERAITDEAKRKKLVNDIVKAIRSEKDEKKSEEEEEISNSI